MVEDTGTVENNDVEMRAENASVADEAAAQTTSWDGMLRSVFDISTVEEVASDHQIDPIDL